MRKFSFLALLICSAPLNLFPQFGGRPGDVVIYMMSSKGEGDFHVVPNSTVNSQPGFVIENPNDLPLEPFGPDFPAESRHKMHAEPGDVFNVIIQREDDYSPHQMLLETVKVFLVDGILRLEPAGKTPIDVTGGLYVPFPKGIDFGPNQGQTQGLFLMWTPAPFFPATAKADPSYRSPLVPPKFASGVDYLLSTGVYDTLVPWVGLNQEQPGMGWQPGIDSKLIEQDNFYGTRLRLLRLRPGRKTPTFRVNANMHLWILSGKVTITPASGTPAVMEKNIYAFVPPGFAFQLSNPAEYHGPGSQ
jgi:hypothetical protein